MADAALYARWIKRELAADPPRVPSLLITVYGDALVPHGGRAWLATLIRLLAGFGVNERAVRTGVFRVARDGWLEAETFGRRSRYGITAEGAARFAHAFHRVYDVPFEPWDGEWEALVARLADFVEAPRIDHRGTEREQAKAMVADPSGNLIELKAYRDPRAVLGELAA